MAEAVKTVGGPRENKGVRSLVVLGSSRTTPCELLSERAAGVGGCSQGDGRVVGI